METSESADLSGDFENGARKNAGVNSENANLSEYDGHSHTIVTITCVRGVRLPCEGHVDTV